MQRPAAFSKGYFLSAHERAQSRRAHPALRLGRICQQRLRHVPDCKATAAGHRDSYGLGAEAVAKVAGEASLHWTAKRDPKA